MGTTHSRRGPQARGALPRGGPPSSQDVLSPSFRGYHTQVKHTSDHVARSRSRWEGGRPQKKPRLALPPRPWTLTPQAPGPSCTFQGARRPNLPGVGVFERQYASPRKARGDQAASLRWHWVREARKEGIRSEKNAQVQPAGPMPPRKAAGAVPPAAPPPPSLREDSAPHGRHSGWRADQRFLPTKDPRHAGAALRTPRPQDPTEHSVLEHGITETLRLQPPQLEVSRAQGQVSYTIITPGAAASTQGQGHTPR